MTYRKTILAGFGYLSLLKLFMKVLTLGKIVVIARILSPKDLGLFGLTTVVLSLVEVMTETGINTFLIQKKDSISKYLHTAYCISIVRGLLIAIVVFALSFFLSSFYKEPYLFNLLMIVSFIPLIKGFINPAIIQYNKDMKYSIYALLRSVIFFIEITSSVALTFVLKSPSALLYAMVISAMSEVIISQVFVSPKPTWKLNISYAKEILHFGKWLNMSGLFSFLGNNMDDLITGKVLGTAQLGFYQTAFNVGQSSIGEVGDLASQTLFPIYSKLSNNRQSIRSVFIKVSIPIAILILIPMILLFLFPTQLVSLVLGAKWIPIVPVLPWLLVSAYFQAIDGVIYPIYLAVYKPHYSTIIVFINLIVMLVTIIPLSLSFGLIGVGISVFLSKLIVQPLYGYYAWSILWGKKRTA